MPSFLGDLERDSAADVASTCTVAMSESNLRPIRRFASKIAPWLIGVDRGAFATQLVLGAVADQAALGRRWSHARSGRANFSEHSWPDRTLESKNMEYCTRTSKSTRRGTTERTSRASSRVCSRDSNLALFAFFRQNRRRAPPSSTSPARVVSGTSARDAETRDARLLASSPATRLRPPPRAMKLKQLESLLRDVEPFREPDQMLEQYPTGAHPASRVVAEAHAHGDIEGRAVVDLGVGGGVLTIASLLMGAAKVTGLDLDPNALDLTRENCAAFDPPLEIALALARIPRDVARLRRRVTREEIRSVDARDARERHDTTLCRRSEDERTDTDEDSNRDSPTSFLALRADTRHHEPPFGTRRRGADLEVFARGAHARAQRGVQSEQDQHARARRAARDAGPSRVVGDVCSPSGRTSSRRRTRTTGGSRSRLRWTCGDSSRRETGAWGEERGSRKTLRATTLRDGVGESGVGIGFGFGRRAKPSGLSKKRKNSPDQVRGRARRATGATSEPRRAGRSGGKGARDSRAVIAGKRKRRKGPRRGKVRRRRSGPGRR